jgi:hypothetical protein
MAQIHRLAIRTVLNLLQVLFCMIWSELFVIHAKQDSCIGVGVNTEQKHNIILWLPCSQHFMNIYN